MSGLKDQSQATHINWIKLSMDFSTVVTELKFKVLKETRSVAWTYGRAVTNSKPLIFITTTLSLLERRKRHHEVLCLPPHSQVLYYILHPTRRGVAATSSARVTLEKWIMNKNKVRKEAQKSLKEKRLEKREKRVKPVKRKSLAR